MSEKSKREPYVSETPMTYGDYAAMPDDGFRYELVNSRLELMSPGPTSVHQFCLEAIRDVIMRSCENDYIIMYAPLDVILSETDVRQPDLLAIHRSRKEIIKLRGVFGAPDLVVEILSRGSVKRDRKEKLDTYSRYAVPEYWLIDPMGGTLEQYLPMDGALRLYEVCEGEATVVSPHLACVAFTMAQVMAQVPNITD